MTQPWPFFLVFFLATFLAAFFFFLAIDMAPSTDTQTRITRPALEVSSKDRTTVS